MNYIYNDITCKLKCSRCFSILDYIRKFKEHFRGYLWDRQSLKIGITLNLLNS